MNDRMPEAERMALEKQLRVLSKKLERSEADRAELEITKEKSDALLRKVIVELGESQADLKAKGEQLQTTLTELNAAQDVLIQTEKMAALGELVAGVAHEINTPVGVGVTAASHLVDLSKRLREAMDGSTLTASSLSKFVRKTSEAAEIILQNLSRASNLVQSFKLVVVDRSHSGVREYNMAEYTSTVLNSMSASFRKKRVVTNVSGDEGIMMRSDPGLFSQVLTNLAMNSLVHGFSAQDSGAINIEFKAEGRWLYLNYHDDGCGIEAAHMERIFDPFFTTRRGQGGSGLGLNIVYNIVVSKLGGSIKCQSAPGQGTRFLIRIPGVVDSFHPVNQETLTAEDVMFGTLH